MKSEKKKRLLAVVLCMVIVLSNSSFISASAETEQPAAVSEETVQQDVQEAGESAAGAADAPALLSETAPEETPEATSETTQTPEVTTEPTQASEETAEATQVPEMTETPEATSGEIVDQTQEAAAEPVQEPTSTPDSETAEVSETEGTQAPTEATLKSNEPVELKQEFQDENGNVTATVTAQIPAGAFQADASELTMEVTVPDQAATENVKKLMEESLPENYILGDTILYDIRFKVSGMETESQQPIVITFENQDGIDIKDVKKAVVFQLDPADPAVEGDKDELVTITQRNDMIEYLQNSGQSTDNVDDYDLSEITLKEDGTSDKIQMEGRTSTIYGCYAYYEPVQVLTYENDQVTVTVSAAENGIIPADAELKVVPITEDKETEDQYKDVEKKLQEKAEEEEYEIAGFLAYDITFVDRDGNETEPSGEVKVSIDYKEAAIPESISEEDAQNAEVTVLHLEEDENGDVKEVVDMAQNEKVDVLTTTEENKIEKAEVRTESFSWFVIQWGRKDRAYVYYVDINGNVLDVGQQGSIVKAGSGDNIELVKYAKSISGYDYQYASINKVNGTQIYSVKKDSNGWSYKKKENGTDYPWYGDNKYIYLVYKAVSDELTEVDTVDNTQAGITMRMTDYDKAAGGISFGGSYGQGNVKQGLLQNRLVDGYPKTIWEEGNKSLASLFNAGTTVNHLFLQDTYDETGYYEYSSFENYAYLGSGTDFTVYEQIGTPKNDTNFFYKRGNFMPYNKIIAGKYSTNTNMYDEDGNELEEGDSRYNERLYLTQDTNNYYFGMYMEVDFLQPKDGYAIHNNISNPMIYEFNGDDDLWIYIDDVLVLDIGGIHDAHSGYINFATGDVHVECISPDKKNQDTTIKAMYKAAGVLPDGSAWNNEKADLYFEGNTFRDYTTHTLKMFYMERGAGASNLHMKFNLQTVPDGAIEVTKELSNTDKEKYANVEFAFQVFAQQVVGYDTDGNELYSQDQYVTLDDAVNKNTEESIEFNSETIGGKTYENVFYLKPGETAQFNDLQNNRKYYVIEIGVKTEEYDQVIINGTEITDLDEDGQETSKIKDIVSTEEEVYKRPAIVFENNCSAKNSRELWITKNMAEGQTTKDTFSFHIQLTDQDGNFADYQGNYYLMKDGNYYYYQNGALQNNGTSSKICGTTSNGIIPQVGVGYSIKLTGVLSGTQYKVWEIDPNDNLSEEKYNDPVYTSDDTDATSDDNKTYTSGVIELGEHVKITVTNALLNQEDNPMIKVQKTFSGLTQDEIDTLTNFKIIVKDQNQNDVAILKLSKDDCKPCQDGVMIQGPTKSETETEITYTWWIKNVDAGTYHVTENGEKKDGYTVTTTVNGSDYSDNISVTTQESMFKANGIGRITEQSSTEYKFEDIDVIVISLTDTETTEYVVWSEDTLSAGERKGLQNAISEAGNGQFGNSNFGTSNKIVFFSTREIIEKGFYYRGKISVDGDGNLVFEGGKHQWNMIWLGTYERKGSVDAEIELVNTYQTADMDVDLEKYGTGWSQQIAGATFELVSGVKGETEVTWNEDTKKSITVDDTVNPVVELTELKSGYYRLKETQAPVGYSLLNEDIYFVVNAEDKTVQLTDVNGNIPTKQEQAFFRISNNKIQVMNEALYDLPSAGGSGIFWYLIGGTAFLMAASLILYRMKRKEVLGK